MRRKLTIAVDDALVVEAERLARSREVLLSGLIKTSLRETLTDDASSFAVRWRGGFRTARRNDPR